MSLKECSLSKRETIKPIICLSQFIQLFYIAYFEKETYLKDYNFINNVIKNITITVI